MREGAGGEHGAGLTSFRRFTWWTVPGTSVCLLVLFYGEWLLDPDVPVRVRVPVAVALVVDVVASAVLLGGRLTPPAAVDGAPPARLPRAWTAVSVAAMVVLAVLPLARRDYELWAVAPAVTVAICAAHLGPRHRRTLIVGAVLLALVPGGAVSLAAGDGELAHAALFPAGLVAFTVWMVLGPLWAWNIAGRLDRARRLEAESAVKDERLRFAAELHDIQGHHLQVIALKSELAARLVERDPARAAAEMREVRQLSADALRDTRAVVRGYRRTTLDDEIANAGKVLAAAGIDARTALEPASLPAGLTDTGRHLLGLVMREATTNVLRHSRARYAEVDCRVVDGRVRLRMTNDGADGQPADTDGTGLTALDERLRAAQGELTWHLDGDRFEVTASLPLGPGSERSGSRAWDADDGASQPRVRDAGDGASGPRVRDAHDPTGDPGARDSCDRTKGAAR
ncbi:sensor histidine kinase [Streptomyces deccanensis]|uniref:sensor histidine kinase n=1 Tax=Streptomyces deccanensis TaxID=424188 RepID=UPI001EFB58F9|nr:histidine kinase [Streptomyces deccanensis]ULR54017.1 histidine kinase [Streptomyces deccanensis]